MRQDVVRTALTLYESGTYSLETAARHAGRNPDVLREHLLSRGIHVDEGRSEVVSEQARVAAD